MIGSPRAMPLLRRLTSCLRRFRADARGVTAVEMSIVGVPILAALFATFEIAYVHYQSEFLTSAVSKAARAMLTGKAQALPVTTSAQFVSTYLCPTTGRILPRNVDCSKLIVDVRPATSFAAGDTSKSFYKSASNKFCPGAPGQIVVLRVAYPLAALLPLSLFNRSAGVANDVPGMSGNYHILLGTALFQGENYITGYTPPAGC